MRVTTCTCDRCGKPITGGTVYKLTCYAEDVIGRPFLSADAAEQNIRQNTVIMANGEKDLCQECKDALTDGLFIV